MVGLFLKRRKCPRENAAFTLTELLVALGMVALLASLLLPGLAAAKAKALGLTCLHNTRQITLAWLLYADDNADKCASNGQPPLGRNWLDNFMSWDKNPDNTNAARLRSGLLGVYTAGIPNIYECPADKYLSSEQLQAGWRRRVRSYSMNACIGSGLRFYPDYAQFRKLSSVSAPARLYLLMDEHADTISTPWIPTSPDPAGTEWEYLPASYHNGAAMFSFVDGHCEGHKWVVSSTRNHVAFQPPSLKSFRAFTNPDYAWVAERSSVPR